MSPRARCSARTVLANCENATIGGREDGAAFCVFRTCSGVVFGASRNNWRKYASRTASARALRVWCSSNTCSESRCASSVLSNSAHSVEAVCTSRSGKPSCTESVPTIQDCNSRCVGYRPCESECSKASPRNCRRRIASVNAASLEHHALRSPSRTSALAVPPSCGGSGVATVRMHSRTAGFSGSESGAWVSTSGSLSETLVPERRTTHPASTSASKASARSPRNSASRFRSSRGLLWSGVALMSRTSRLAQKRATFPYRTVARVLR